MASRKKNNGSSRSSSKKKNGAEAFRRFSTSSSSDESDRMFDHHNCRNAVHDHFSRSRVEPDQQTGQQEGARREENPFSFKHFLKSDSQINYYETGARPKIYSSPTSSPNSLEKDTGVYSRNPTELPDFVQDHLIIEQCYLNQEPNHEAMHDVDNLPDFTFNGVGQRQSKPRHESKKCQSELLCDLPFDFTGSLEKGLPHRDCSVPNIACPRHLNLPIFNRPAVNSMEPSEGAGFPFDLPLPLNECDLGANNSARDSTSTNKVNIPKSLPDFLNDGPIHNRTTLSTDSGPNLNMAESTERRLLLENERLRQELDAARRQISEKLIRIQLLESELASRKEVEHEETAHLEKAMEQVEDNLKHSTRRAVSAENTVASLKKEIKALTTEISLLRLENNDLRSGTSLIDKNECGDSSDRMIKRLADDLRTAASSAEISLRQLISGVDNLRVLASTLENMDRIEDRTKDFLSDFDENNATGPAP